MLGSSLVMKGGIIITHLESVEGPHKNSCVIFVNELMGL